MSDNKIFSTKVEYKKIAFVTSHTEEAQKAQKRLLARYGCTPIDDAEIIVVLGGDGLMLQTAHKFMNIQKPIYGMHCGSIGFLMNELNENDLLQRLATAERSIIHPLTMSVTDIKGVKHTAQAINEVSMLRQTYQASKLRITIDNKTRMNELMCDGILVATPAGSTAYNLSAHGPILPINSPLLALTPLSPFRPRRWRGAIVSNKAHIRIDILEPEYRPVSAVADNSEVRDVMWVEIAEDTSSSIFMLFDPGHNLDERILREQFLF